MNCENGVGYYCNKCGTLLVECQNNNGIYYGEKPEVCDVCGSTNIELDVLDKEN